MLWKLWAQAGRSGMRPDGRLVVNFELLGIEEGPDEADWAMDRCRQRAPGRFCIGQRMLPEGSVEGPVYEVFEVTPTGLALVGVVLAARRDPAEAIAEAAWPGRELVILSPKGE